MSDEYIESLPNDLQKMLNKAFELEKTGFSQEWYSLAKDILWKVHGYIADNMLTKNDFEKIRKNYLKNVGVLGDTENTDFLKFFTTRK